MNLKIRRYKKSIIIWCAKSLLIAACTMLISWGKFGHEHINAAAVMELPKPMQQFFYDHIDYLTVEANLPDVRKYTMADSAEFPRHHIHLESFGNYDDIPKSSKEIKLKYDKKFFAVHGNLPWYIQEVMVKLTEAMKNNHKSDILFFAADLGHYVGDAYMPLHTSINHNGTATAQKGVHGLFESQIPEMFGNTYNYNTGEAKFINDIQKETWRIVVASNHTADTLLTVDRDLQKTYKPEQVFLMDSAKKIKTNMYGDYIYTTEYIKAYHGKLNGMVERQLRGAIATTANYWYTAWVNAGKPDLSALDSPVAKARNAKNFGLDMRIFKQGKLPVLKTEKEF